MDKLAEQICEIARDGGLFLLNADRQHNRVLSKEGHANFVTEYDTKVQELLKRELLRLLPDAAFIGEEGENHDKLGNGYAFIVDPIDGTTNFIKDFKVSAVSVALLRNGEQYIGVIYNPYLDEMFAAVKGQGAYLNGKRIHVSERPVSEGLVAVGTAPYYEELHEKTVQTLAYYFKHSLDIRRSGSAAIDLCTVACGRAELFIELRLQPWDFAAGSLIVTEAGGYVRTVSGEPLSFDRAAGVIASNMVCKEEKPDWLKEEEA
ncbi:MAG: inositol monophosphatase [Lachnospiraceae bacterium]|nr:inositol monophosphatase [Lachnospiraceae bacterium]